MVIVPVCTLDIYLLGYIGILYTDRDMRLSSIVVNVLAFGPRGPEFTYWPALFYRVAS